MVKQTVWEYLLSNAIPNLYIYIDYLILGMQRFDLTSTLEENKSVTRVKMVLERCEKLYTY